MLSRCKWNRCFLYRAFLVGCFVLGASIGLNAVFAQASDQSDHAPLGWFLAGSKPASYRTGIDAQMMENGLPSAYLRSTVQDTGGFGTLMQSVSAAEYAGKRVRLRAMVRSDNVTDWAGLWMRIDKEKAAVGFDNMQQRPIRGSQPWTTHSVVLDVPPDATGISFGTLLSGSGEVWLNDVKLEVVGEDVETTGTRAPTALPKSPVNLDFQKH
jgi:hypothetical protein